MKRVRISTTVDAARLEACRRLVKEPDSALMDRALLALIDEIEGQNEIRAIEAHPYEDDPELAWDVGDFPIIPWHGEVPKEVLALARARRRRR